MRTDAPLVGASYPTPWGELGVVATTEGTVIRSGLAGLDAVSRTLPPLAARRRVDAGEQPAIAEAVDAWCDAVGEPLSRIEVALEGTAFAVDVWRAMREVPFGETVSYGELAAMAGRPRAARAVGAACAACPALPFLPAHRVIAAGGRLGGFGPGGEGLKRALLAHEGVEVSA